MMKKKTNQITTVVSFILDESGSMGSIVDSVITGFNEYVQGLKSRKEEVLFSFTKFDSDHVEIVEDMEQVKNVAPLTLATYRPGAATPLYDAVVETVEKLKEKVNDKQAIIVAIMTDGLENASQKHNQKCLQDLIHNLEHKGNWTFVFMGANQDSWAVAQNFGISQGNIMDWQATHRGTTNAFYAMANSTMDYAGEVVTRSVLNSALKAQGQEAVNLNTSNFFAGSKDASVEKKKQEVKK